MVIADPNVFEFFNLEFVSGDSDSALAGPLDIVLTERAAERYFGNEDPIGQTLNLMDQADVMMARSPATGSMSTGQAISMSATAAPASRPNTPMAPTTTC